MKDINEAAIQKMLAELPPEISTRLTSKYEEDRQAFLAVVEDMRPSNKAAYWAKSSCTKCYGRGIIGSIHNSMGTISLPCPCADKKYNKWLITTRKFYLALKELGHEETQRNRPEASTEALKDSSEG